MDKLIYALTSKERAQVLRFVKSHSDNVSVWRQEKGKIPDETFYRLLAVKGFDYQSFNNSIQNMALIDEALQASLAEVVLATDWYQYAQALISKDLAVARPPVTIEMVFARLADLVVEGLKQQLANLQCVHFSQAIYEVIRLNLAQACFNICAKTLVADFHETGGLIASYIETRFGDLQKTVDFLQDYPTLYRLVFTKLAHLERFYSRFFDDLDQSYDAIVHHFPEIQDQPIVMLNFGAGDSHNQGESVVIVSYPKTRLVYKPSDGQANAAFNDLLRYLNAYPGLLPFKISRDFYGNGFHLCRFIEQLSCRDQDEVARFYERCGQYLSLLYLLKATDIHFENLIAHGEFPCIIDCETVFGLGDYQLQSARGAAEQVANAQLLDSLHRVGMLPIYLEGSNVGALDGQGGDSNDKWVFVSNGYDDMRFEAKRLSISGSHNLVTLADQAVKFEDYHADFLRGYQAMCRLIDSHREELLSYIEVLFARNFKVRAIFKNTQVYADLLSFVGHPNYAKDMTCLERAIDNIYARELPKDEVYLSELDDILNGDIPVFYSDLQTSNLWDSHGRVIASFFECTSQEVIRQRIGDSQAGYEAQGPILAAALGRRQAQVSRQNLVLAQRQKMADIEPLELNQAIGLLEALILARVKIVDQDITYLEENDDGLGLAQYGRDQGLGGLLLLAQYSQDDRIGELAQLVRIKLLKALTKGKITKLEPALFDVLLCFDSGLAEDLCEVEQVALKQILRYFLQQLQDSELSLEQVLAILRTGQLLARKLDQVALGLAIQERAKQLVGDYFEREGVSRVALVCLDMGYALADFSHDLQLSQELKQAMVSGMIEHCQSQPSARCDVKVLSNLASSLPQAGAKRQTVALRVAVQHDQPDDDSKAKGLSGQILALLEDQRYGSHTLSDQVIREKTHVLLAYLTMNQAPRLAYNGPYSPLGLEKGVMGVLLALYRVRQYQENRKAIV